MSFIFGKSPIVGGGDGGAIVGKLEANQTVGLKDHVAALCNGGGQSLSLSLSHLTKEDGRKYPWILEGYKREIFWEIKKNRKIILNIIKRE